MTDERWLRVKALFQAAVERPAEERGAFLAAATGDDAALRREVESLLAADSPDLSVLDRLPMASESVFAHPFAALPASMGPTPSHALVRLKADTTYGLLAAGRRVGPYEILPDHREPRSTIVTSVCTKSSPLKSSGCPVEIASAYEKQSP